MRNIRQALKSKKAELEVTLSSFTADQEKLHDNYEKKKQEITDKIESLHKTLEKLETDISVEPAAESMQRIGKCSKCSSTKNPSNA